MMQSLNTRYVYGAKQMVSRLGSFLGMWFILDTDFSQKWSLSIEEGINAQYSCAEFLLGHCFS